MYIGCDMVMQHAGQTLCSKSLKKVAGVMRFSYYRHAMCKKPEKGWKMGQNSPQMSWKYIKVHDLDIKTNFNLKLSILIMPVII